MATMCVPHCASGGVFVNSCAYLRQFAHTDDVFAAQDLLQATGWWEDAGVLVLDEFDPGRLVRTVQLDSADGMDECSLVMSICAISAALARNMLLGDRTLTGHVLLGELEAL